MPRIQIVTAGPLCRNPRVLKEATALGRAGFEVTVVTLANIERFEAYDRELLLGAPFQKLALDRISHGPVNRVARVAERGLARVARSALRLGIQSAASLGPVHALRRLVERTPAELTILHTEIPFTMGRALAARGRRIAADFEDWHSRDLLPESRAARPNRLLEACERHLLRSALYCSAPSDAMAQALHGAYGGRRPITLPNTFPIQPQPFPVPRQHPPAFFWFSQTIGEGRGLEEFLAGWSLSKAPSRVCLLGDVSDRYRGALLAGIPSDRRDRVRFLPLTDPDSLPSIIAEHDIGLALEPPSPESRFLTTTNKIFQYLNAGLAILATPTAGQREVLARIPDAGLLTDLEPAEALASKIDALVSDTVRLGEMGAAARLGAVRYFSWEQTAPRLVEAVNRALKS